MLSFREIFTTMHRRPWYVRLFVIFSSFVLLEVPVTYLMMHSVDRSIASVLFFSGVLAALLFRWKKAFAIQCILLASHVTIVYHIKGPSYPSVSVIIMATFTNFFIIWTIGCLRRGWDMAEENAEEQKRLIDLKDQFIRLVSHETLNPLTSVIGALDILKNYRDELGEQEREMFLDQSISACDALKMIIRNILGAMKCDSDVSPPYKQEFNIVGAITDVLRHIDREGHVIQIDYPEELIAYGDSQQVSLIVQNLLSNAFKYSPEGTSVLVRSWADDIDTYVSVKDQGPGVTSEDIPHLFKKLSRLKCDIAGPVRGIGLGLYLCRRYVSGMGGKIWIESTGIEGEGSTFTFTVPCAAQTTYKLKVVGKKRRIKS